MRHQPFKVCVFTVLRNVNRKHSKSTNNTSPSQARDWFSKFDDYLAFSSFFYNEPAFSPDKLYKIFTIDNRIAIVAFNSCLYEGNIEYRCDACFEKDGSEHYFGWINRKQVQQAGQELNSLGWQGLRIGMFHHHINSANALSEESQCQGDHLRNYYNKKHRLEFVFAKQHFRILLYGHKHKGDLYQSNKVGTKIPYNFGAGSFWNVAENSRETANYLVLQLSPLKGRSRILMRRYYPATDDRSGYWGADDTITPDGIVPLQDIMIPSPHNTTND